MSAGDEIEQIARNIFELVRGGFEIGTRTPNETVNDSLNILGLDVTATEGQINRRYRDLSHLVHPDTSPFDEDEEIKRRAFDIAGNARDYLRELEFEGEAHEAAESQRQRGAPSSPGTGGWGPIAEDRQEQYRKAYENIKIFYVQEFFGIEIFADTLDEAIQKGQISQQQIELLEDTLREQFGVPELTLDDIARVLASLVVSGSIRMGNIDRMAERSSVFGGPGASGGVFGGGDDSVFKRSGRGGREDSVFK